MSYPLASPLQGDLLLADLLPMTARSYATLVIGSHTSLRCSTYAPTALRERLRILVSTVGNLNWKNLHHLDFNINFVSVDRPTAAGRGEA